MIHALFETSERRVSDLAAVGSSESATSHRLRRLRLAELVPGDRQGRTAHCRLADSRVRLLLETAIEHHLHDGETS